MAALRFDAIDADVRSQITWIQTMATHIFCVILGKLFNSLSQPIVIVLADWLLRDFQAESDPQLVSFKAVSLE